MASILFLDDCPTRRAWAKNKFDVNKNYFAEATTAQEAISWIEWGQMDDDEWGGPYWTEVYLDHDLGDEAYVDSSRKDCGMEVVRWICENKPKLGRIVVHTMNTPAGHAMCRALKRAGYDVKYQSFYRLYNGFPGLEGRQIHGC